MCALLQSEERKRAFRVDRLRAESSVINVDNDYTEYRKEQRKSDEYEAMGHCTVELINK